jgi:hypothetical protein
LVYDPPIVRAPSPNLVLALIAAAGLAACGGNSGADSPSAVTTRTSTAPPALATRPPATGEIVLRGDGSPATKGPHVFKGRYLVRFQQYAPEDPTLDFTGQTPFSAQLTVTPNDPRGAVKLFEDAAATGREELEIRGRRYVDVTFGDFPWVMRFTPRGGA